MKNIIIWTILSLFNCVFVSANNLVFEYGKNPGIRSFTDQITGEIGLHEQHKKIFLNLPSCRTIEYVRIEVENPYSVPRVAFDSATRRVIIAYSPLQRTASTYDIQVKSRRADDCTGDVDGAADQSSDDSKPRISLDYYGY